MNKKLELLVKGTDINIDKVKKCIYCGSEFAIFDIEKKFLDKHGFSETPQCSSCTFRMLNSLINDKHLYRRKDSETNEPIISIFSPESERVIYEHHHYMGLFTDDLGLDYTEELGNDIMGQYRDLCNNFPKASRVAYEGLENCDYTSHIAYAKNCYLSFGVFTDCENIYFSFQVVGGCRNIFSSYSITKSQNIFSSSRIEACFNTFYSKNSYNSSNIWYCSDMNTCEECFFCFNQVNQKYMVFNKKYSREEYKKIKEDILAKLNDKDEKKNLLDHYNKFVEENYMESALNLNRTEKVIGDTTFNSTNCTNVFTCQELENSCNVSSCGGDGVANNNIFNCVELGAGVTNSLGSVTFGYGVNNIFFSMAATEGSNNLYYCQSMKGCAECMFSMGLVNKKYIILNKQYKKEEYFKLKEKIIEKLKNEGEWGTYPWFDLQIFPYNDTLAYDYFKVNKVIRADGKEEIIDKNAKGIVTLESDNYISKAKLNLGGEKKIDITWRTKEKEINIPTGIKTIEAKDLKSLYDSGDDLLDLAIICEESGRPYRIIKEELEFCKKHSLSLPTIHHELRVDKLLHSRPVFEMHVGVSDLSGEKILSVYKDKPKWKVYDWKEYDKKMYL